MYDALIKNYLKKVRPLDVKVFASKYNVSLKENEENVIYEVIQKNYKELMQKDFKNTINILKANLSKETFDTLMTFYDKYKEEIDKYLPLE